MRELYEVDIWIRLTLRDNNSPAKTLEMLREMLRENAVDLGYIEHADGSWRFAGSHIWGPEVVAVEQVPYAPEELFEVRNPPRAALGGAGAADRRMAMSEFLDETLRQLNAMTDDAAWSIAELEHEVQSAADAKPGRPQAERVVTLTLATETIGPNQVPQKLLKVTAVYAPFCELMILYGHPEYVKGGFRVKGYSYVLFDAGRAPWEQTVQMTREKAVALLDGIDPPAMPMPATWGKDPFEGLVD